LGEEIGKRIQQYGGAALIIDYGDDHVHASSLQGVKQHTKKHVLEESGTVDLSSHVDFCALKNVAVADRGTDAFTGSNKSQFS
jgi:SAM-dependent MidA family methyltransferase